MLIEEFLPDWRIKSEVNRTFGVSNNEAHRVLGVIGNMCGY